MVSTVTHAPGHRLVVVAGPTATGKTELGLRLAERIGGEIVCGDSVQLLEGFEIGSAAPTREERERVPHHLFHSFSPLQPPDAGRYAAAADAAIDEVVRRGRVPIVVGGTGLYLRALLDGLAPSPRVPEPVRDEIARELQSNGIGPLWNELVAVDPDLAARIEGGARNTQRVLRALEVFRATGKPLSEYQAEHTPTPRYQAFFLVARAETEALRARIDRRVDVMLAAGLEGEVAALLARGVPRDGRALATLGYAEVVRVLDGDLPRGQLRKAIAAGHWAYARRQRTWFKRVAGAVEVDMLAPDAVDVCTTLVNESFERGRTG